MSDSPVYVTLSSDKIRLLWKSLAQVAVFLVWNVNYKVAVVLSFLGFGFVVYFNIRYNGTNKETSWLVKMVFTLSLHYTCSFAHEILLLKHYNSVSLCNSVFTNIAGLISKFALIYGLCWLEKSNIWKACFRKPFGILDWHKHSPDIILLWTRYICWLWLI